MNDLKTQKMSQFEQLESVSDDMSIPVIQDGKNKKITYQKLMAEVKKAAADLQKLVEELQTNGVPSEDIDAAVKDYMNKNPVVTVDSELSYESENPVQNKIVKAAISGLKEDLSQLSEEIADQQTEINNKQPKGDYALKSEVEALPNNETLIENVAEVVKTEVPLIKTAEQPTFVDSIDKMTDTTKVYVMPDGYLYGYREIENYNLLKPSEVSYSSRLQNDVEGITTSTVHNLVTGWIPVKYGKYYGASILNNGDRVIGYGESSSFIVRMNLQLADGSIVVYNNNDYTWRDNTYGVGNYIIKILHENAVAMRVQFYIITSVNNATDFKLLEPMIVEGDSVADAYNKTINYEYISGDTETTVEWRNTGLVYNQPVDYEERVIELESDVSNIQEHLAELESNIGNPLSASPYYRDVNFGVLPFSYYRGVADSYENSAFGWTTQYADYIALWKSLVEPHSSYVTETALGVASDGQTIYLYNFKPVGLSNSDKPIPKIIIIAGQHGGETANVFGLYYFVANLLNRWNQHPALEYLRNHVELMIVPVLNTYGFDNRSYKNANGVNLNRNYDSKWTLVEDTTSNQYGGAEPFDQSETQIVRDLLLNNKDAVLVIDSHVNGGGKVANYSDINYYGVSESTDSYYNRMIDAVAYNLSAISANFNLDYELGQPNTILGFLNNDDGVGLLRNWGRDNNFVSVLVEGFGGFPSRTAYTAEVFKANEEIIVNWLITAMNYLSK